MSAIQESVPKILACGGIFTYCKLADIATITQQIGMICAGITAVIVLVHTVWKIWKGK